MYMCMCMHMCICHVMFMFMFMCMCEPSAFSRGGRWGPLTVTHAGLSFTKAVSPFITRGLVEFSVGIKPSTHCNHLVAYVYPVRVPVLMVPVLDGCACGRSSALARRRGRV